MDDIGNNVAQRNPWLAEGTLDSLRNVLAMAESTGILQKVSLNKYSEIYTRDAVLLKYIRAMLFCLSI